MKEEKKSEEGRNNSLNRRQFLKDVGIAGMAAAYGLSNPNFVSQAFAAEPKRGGRLVFDVRKTPNAFDTTYWETREEYDVGRLCYNNLIRTTPDMKLVPELAERWASSKKGKEWTFWLRKGIKFHHGRELEAKDVVTCMNHYLEAKGPAAAELAPAEKFEVIDKYTVNVVLSKPFGEFPVNLAKPQAAILPHDISFEKLKTTVSGTGPFKFKKLVPGEYLLVERNQEYWEKGLPFLDEVKQLVIPDIATAMNGLISGEIDVMHDLEPDQYFHLKKTNGIVARRSPGMGFQNIIMDTRVKPFDDPRVRQAIKACIDREKFVAAVVQGLGTPAGDHPIPPLYPYYADFPTKKQDHALAKKLLAEAGYPNGLKLKLHTSEIRIGMVPSAITLKDHCAPAGIDIEVKVEPSDGYWKRIWRKVPFCGSNWSGRPNMYGSLQPFFHSQGKWNTAQYGNPTIDGCLDEGVGETDANRAMRLYVGVQSLVSELGGWLIPYTRDKVSAHRDVVQDYEVHPTEWRYYSRIWKKA